mgnify:CR=1 FL=1
MMVKARRPFSFTIFDVLAPRGVGQRLLQNGLVHRKIVRGEAAEDHLTQGRSVGQRTAHRRHGHARRQGGGVAIYARADARKRQAAHPVRHRQRDRAAVARGQQRGLSGGTTVPDRPHGVDHMPGGQAKTRRDSGVARLAAPQGAAGLQQLGAVGPGAGHKTWWQRLFELVVFYLLVGGLGPRLPDGLAALSAAFYPASQPLVAEAKPTP